MMEGFASKVAFIYSFIYWLKSDAEEVVDTFKK